MLPRRCWPTKDQQKGAAFLETCMLAFWPNRWPQPTPLQEACQVGLMSQQQLTRSEDSGCCPQI